MRILADHSRGTAALIADGVVPSNEDRGYVLRRIMRRAIQQGRSLGLEPPYMDRFAERAIELLARPIRGRRSERETILRWVRDEEESFGRTLDRGTELLEELIAQAKEEETSWIDAADAFRLHDTYGFPYDLTKELLAEQGLSVDDQGFEELMEEQRQRARVGTATAHGSEDHHGAVLAFASARAGDAASSATRSSAPRPACWPPSGEDGRLLAKLEESPFYAEGGGQVADSGVVSWERRRDRPGGRRLSGGRRPGWRSAAATRTLAGWSRGRGWRPRWTTSTRHATMRNHTATHLLHAALREVLGAHVRQAGSAVRPDKLRFDFTHGAPLSVEEVREVGRPASRAGSRQSHPVRAMQMSREEAERLGAMALFGEKYGDWVRVIEVEDVSRELCGGTHVANTAEIGIFAIASEGSSAANVRRIEALTGPAAIDWFRGRSHELSEVGRLLGSEQDPLARRAPRPASGSTSSSARRRPAARRSWQAAEELATAGEEIEGIRVLAARGPSADQKALLRLADRIEAARGRGRDRPRWRR